MTELLHALVNYEGGTIRRVWHDRQWFFAVKDVVALLTETVDARDYIKKMRKRDPELNSKWGTICPPLGIVSKDGRKRS